MKNELETFRQMIQKQAFAEDNDQYCGILSFCITPDGKVIQYARLIGEDVLLEAPEKVLQFLGDDMMHNFQTKLRALPDTKAESGEDGGLKQKADVNANVTESLDSGADSGEDLWVSEGGS